MVTCEENLEGRCEFLPGVSERLTYGVKEVDTGLSDQERSGEERQNQVGFTEDERNGTDECYADVSLCCLLSVQTYRGDR